MMAKPQAMPGTCGASTARPPAATVQSSSGHRRLSSVVPGLSSGSVVCVRAPASRFAIGGEVAERAPMAMPIDVASTHQPAVT